MLHAHICRESQDCDGRYDHRYTRAMDAEERESEFSDLLFKERVIADAMSTLVFGRLEVTPEGAEWYASTEEGYVSTNIRWCSHETCEFARPEFRDHTAESMGY
jgi:hypothetical protein